MSRKYVFTLFIVIVLLVLFSTIAFANGWEAPAYQDGMTMPTATPLPASADSLPVNPQTGATSAYDGTTTGTMATGTCPMMNGTTGYVWHERYVRHERNVRHDRHERYVRHDRHEWHVRYDWHERDDDHEWHGLLPDIAFGILIPGC